MIRNKWGLILVLLFPILVLFLLTVYKRHILLVGREIILPISGYDPRDLISGHYVTYRVDYGISNLCQGVGTTQAAYVCLDHKTFSSTPPVSCPIYIAGQCQMGQFYAGIERYYIPESEAKQLDELVRAKRASIRISVLPNGKAQVKDLLIDGKLVKH